MLVVWSRTANWPPLGRLTRVGLGRVTRSADKFCAAHPTVIEAYHTPPAPLAALAATSFGMSLARGGRRQQVGRLPSSHSILSKPNDLPDVSLRFSLRLCHVRSFLSRVASYASWFSFCPRVMFRQVVPPASPRSLIAASVQPQPSAPCARPSCRLAGQPFPAFRNPRAAAEYGAGSPRLQ